MAELIEVGSNTWNDFAAHYKMFCLILTATFKQLNAVRKCSVSVLGI